MMAIANDQPMPTWRNFAAWSAVSAIFYILVVWGTTVLLRQDAMGVFRSKQVAAMLSLGLIFSMAVTGFSSRTRPINVRNLRNFTIQYAVAITLFLLALWGFRTYGGRVAMGTSEWVAIVTGAVLILVAFFGTLVTAVAHTRADLIDDEAAADDLRERGRLFLYSFAWMATYGLLLIGLGLARPGGLLSPATALAGAVVLIAVLTVLGIAAWRLSDELGRTLSHETGNMAFYLILVLGGGWAMLAHLGLMAAPAPLDWLTLFTVLLFVASIVATGRRNLLTR